MEKLLTFKTFHLLLWIESLTPLYEEDFDYYVLLEEAPVLRRATKTTIWNLKTNQKHIEREEKKKGVENF